MNTTIERLQNERLFWDGGTGSILQARGLQPGELPETWNLTNPSAIEELAYEYYCAGSDIVNTNTFGLNALKFPGQVAKIAASAVEITKRARARAGRPDALVALDLGPTGKLLAPLGDLDFERAVSLYGEVAEAGTKAGADLILIETMGDLYEAKAAVLGAKEHSDLPVCVTFTFDGKGKLLTGGNPAAAVAVFEGLGVSAIGMNCGLGPVEMLPLVREFSALSSIPVIITPNAGLPFVENGKTVYPLSPGAFAAAMRDVASAGVQILGGCCGTTPDHIRAMIEAVADIPYRPQTEKTHCFAAGFSGALEIGKKPLVIGERINPTGKKRFKEALQKHDIDYILSQAIEQEDAGADILDVNVGLPGIDEPGLMQDAVTAVQSVTALPLQIDTTDPAALERGLRYVNGKALVNSVNGKEESLNTVLPIVKKYGGVLVCLPLDEGGIPETAEGRLRIARKIVSAAESFGIQKKNLVFDGLTMAVSADPKLGRVTLQTIRLIREELGLPTILGVSNVSFGLPLRENLNAAFLTMSLEEGLSLAIINPNNDAVMSAYRSYLALSEQDPQFSGYIGCYAGMEKKTSVKKKAGGAPESASDASSAAKDTSDGKTSASGPDSPESGLKRLYEAILKGLSAPAKELAREALKNTAPLELVNGTLIPALDKVGKGFESGRIYLPQLLMSAEAAQAAFAAVRDRMAASGASESAAKGRVILATVKNDIHDIGKNIVKVMLENYGYEVLDLGRDVPPETIVDTAIAEDIRLVGLSALMTTTVVSMEETIRLLREKKPDTKVVVGGAVMTADYAAAIGADYYAKDAMETVRFADRVFSN